MKRLRACIACLLGVVFALAGCDETGTDPPPPTVERRAVDLVYVIYPGRTAPGPVELRCGFIIGPDSCWTLESIQVRLEGYNVVVSGTAVKPLGATACGGTVQFDSVTLTTPPLLEVTRYDLLADPFYDDLWIHPAYVPAVEWMLAAGGICPPHVTMEACYRFVPVYPGAVAARGWIIEDWPPLTRCRSAYLYAELRGVVDCRPSGERNAFAVRKVILR